VPTGGVSLENVADWFAAGAFAVGAGGALAPASLERHDRGEVVENARRFAEAAAKGR
jgi:2-dehydro-3-deoxyphosphogluconate aldolase/(4S)-4-hydroxy-2-oxoglutarate aldolase